MTALATGALMGVSRSSFVLPEVLEAHEPAEARGIARDEVRLMASYPRDDRIVHARFTQLPLLLDAGDTLVVNTSATVNAAVTAQRPDGERVVLHRSQRLRAGVWVVELRRLGTRGTLPLLTAQPGETVRLPANGVATLIAPHQRPIALNPPSPSAGSASVRLWRAAVQLPEDEDDYLTNHGFPIRYGYVPRQWPLSRYQTIFSRDPGSAEMPSAARPFTARVVQALKRKGVAIAPILLHTGVSSLESHEPPDAEPFRVDARTARVVNETKRRGGRVVAVGTTVVRAIETVASSNGTVSAGAGWTDLVITPVRGLYAVDALLTGFHEPRASHLEMLQALAGRRHIEAAYEAALAEHYLWHEFGDVHLVMPFSDSRSASRLPDSVVRRRRREE